MVTTIYAPAAPPPSETKCIKGKVAIRPQYRKYVEWMENLEPGAPLLLPGKSPIALYLSSVITLSGELINSPFCDLVPKHAEVVETYGDALPLVLTGPLAEERAFLVFDRVARLLDAFIPSVMMQEICARTQVAHIVGVSEKDVINDLIRECDLTGMIDYDALKKRQQRFREAQGMSNYNIFKGRRPKRR